MASKSQVLYVGVTNNLIGRVVEHKSGRIRGFTRRYRVSRLVYYEVETDVREAIAREKQIKGWRRQKKIALIENFNSNWEDLYDGLLESGVPYWTR